MGVFKYLIRLPNVKLFIYISYKEKLFIFN